MVARLTPDQKVACSIHVGFKSTDLFAIFLLNRTRSIPLNFFFYSLLLLIWVGHFLFIFYSLYKLILVAHFVPFIFIFDPSSFHAPQALPVDFRSYLVLSVILMFYHFLVWTLRSLSPPFFFIPFVCLVKSLSIVASS